ncbi:MAG: anti-sigma factor family protein [Gemmatimonadales bacterium]
MHLDEERVQRLLHRELAPQAEGSARDHLASCSECRSRVAEAEREETRILALLRQVDHPPRRVDVEAITAGSRQRAPGWGRWAAGILLVLGAGAAYALPGSPLPRLVERVIKWVEPEKERPAPVAPSGQAEGAARGIAVAPGDRFTVRFSTAPADGLATVSLTDAGEVAVRALSGAASFTSEPAGISIDAEGASGRFEILIPREAPSVEIRIGGRRVFLKQGSRVFAEGGQDAEGRYLVPLSPSTP